jgi:16S rRNA (uracil1498-N3)-methyltransferase
MPRAHHKVHRLYVPGPLAADALVPLDEDQANYLLNVLRMEQGEAVILFNGSDGAWMGAVRREGKRKVAVELSVQTAHQTRRNDLWFGFAPIKVGRLDWMIERATEMGAGAIQPVITERTQSARLKPDKLRAWTIEAAQQCEVLTVPDVAPEIGLSQLVAGWRTAHGLRRLIYADEQSTSATPVDAIRDLDGLPVGVLIGPEGGFSDAERDILRSQDYVLPISLGPRILRADTAAVAVLTLVQSIIGDWR